MPTPYQPWHYCSRVTLTLLISLVLCPPSARGSDSVAVENQKPGTQDWRIAYSDAAITFAPGQTDRTNQTPLLNVDCRVNDCHSGAEIEGYASATSVNIGGSISFYVRTTGSTASYHMRVFRIGYYNNAGGREVTSEIVQTNEQGQLESLAGKTFPAAPQQDSMRDDRFCTAALGVATLGYKNYGLIECKWSPAYTIKYVPEAWTSGFYLVKLETNTTPSKSRYIIFVVRDDARHSSYLFQSSVLTYQAYNAWGGTSLYGNNSGTAFQSAVDAATTDPNSEWQPFPGCASPCRPANGVKASFLRPYANGVGSGDFLQGELNMVRFLEEEGYDVTYATDIDTHANPALLISHKAFLSVGHDEYWTSSMRINVQRSRDEHRVSLGFFGANDVFWRVRLENSTNTTGNLLHQTMVAYRGTTSSRATGWADPQLPATTQFRVDNPEQMLIGQQFSAYTYNHNLYTVCENGDITIASTASWPSWLASGVPSSISLAKLLGYETNAVNTSSASPSGMIVLATSTFPAAVPPGAPASIPANMTYYQAPSGGHVLSVGSINWSWGLADSKTFIDATLIAKPTCGSSWTLPDENETAKQITRNFLNKVTQAPTQPTVAFARPASSVREGETAAIMIRLSTGNPLTTPVSVNYATQNGQASSPQDFTATSGTVAFGAGSVDGSLLLLSVRTQVDAIGENDETFSVQLSNTSGGILGGQAIHTVTVQNGASDFNSPSTSAPDGNPDLVLRNINSDPAWTGLNAFWMIDGVTPYGLMFDPAAYSRVSDLNWEIRAVADFNFDSRPDMVWQHMLTGQIATWLFYNTTVGSSLYLTTLNTDCGAPPSCAPKNQNGQFLRLVGAGDMNRDGKPDLIWQDPQTFDVSISHMNGLVQLDLVPVSNPIASEPWRVVGVGDINSDGWPDLVWEHDNDGLVAAWFLMDSTVIQTSYLSPSQVAAPWRIVGAADMADNGVRDGLPDVIWENDLTGAIVIWFMNGLSVRSSGQITSALGPPSGWRIVGIK